MVMFLKGHRFMTNPPPRVQEEPEQVIGTDANPIDLTPLTALIPPLQENATGMGTQIQEAVARESHQTLTVVWQSPRRISRDTTRYIIVRNYCYGFLQGEQADQVGPYAKRAIEQVLARVEMHHFRRFLLKHPDLDGAMPTPREREVLTLIWEDKTIAEIAELLDMSRHTVMTHRKRVYAKLGAHRQIQALRAGEEAGLFKYLT
jgi:DNA-binding CsgD family transcriptional regulator